MLSRDLFVKNNTAKATNSAVATEIIIHPLAISAVVVGPK